MSLALIRSSPAVELKHFDRLTWPEAEPAPAKPAVAAGPRVDLQARMRAMWR
jgi:hypothetical protein